MRPFQQGNEKIVEPASTTKPMQTLSRRLILNLKVRLVEQVELKIHGNYRTRLQRRGRIEEIDIRPLNIKLRG